MFEYRPNNWGSWLSVHSVQFDNEANTGPENRRHVLLTAAALSFSNIQRGGQ